MEEPTEKGVQEAHSKQSQEAIRIESSKKKIGMFAIMFGFIIIYIIYVLLLSEFIALQVMPMPDSLLFLNLTEEWAKSHEYIDKEYVCHDFARDEVKLLRRFGYNASVICADIDGMGHEFLIVNYGGVFYPIEATTGTLITEQDFNNYYENIRWCGLNKSGNEEYGWAGNYQLIGCCIVNTTKDTDLSEIMDSLYFNKTSEW